MNGELVLKGCVLYLKLAGLLTMIGKKECLNLDRNWKSRLRQYSTKANLPMGVHELFRNWVIKNKIIQIHSGSDHEKLNLVAKPKKRFVLTTNSNHDNPISENLLNRQFSADRLNHKMG